VLPDGAFRVGGKTWAVEAELTAKGVPRIRRHIEGLLKCYDKAIYFCSDPVLSMARTAQGKFPKGKVEIRSAKTANSLTPIKRSKANLDVYCPSAHERELLALIAEEGTIAVDQLSALSGIEPSALTKELKHMEREQLVGKGYGRGRFAWVWCTYRGTKVTGLGLQEQPILSPARLPRRRALMSVRLTLKASQPEGRWITRRMLESREAGEMAVFEHRCLRIAVMVSLDEMRRADARPAARLAAGYDELWWYCTPESRAWVERQVKRGGWPNVQVLDLPSA
jgi:hypothetical protein